MAQGGVPLVSLEQQFANFSKFGDPRSDGKTITLSQSDRWMEQAKVIDGKGITITDTGVAFNKFKSSRINYHEFVKFLDALATAKEENYDAMKLKLMTCGMPGATNTPAAAGTAATAPAAAGTTPAKT